MRGVDRAVPEKQRTGLVRTQDGAAVVVLGQQADPGQVAHQTGTDDDAVADHDLAVGADDGVGHLDDLALGPFGVAEDGDVEVGGAQPSDRAAAPVGDGFTGQVRRRHAGLFPGRRDEPGGAASVGGAVADGVDPVVVDRPKLVIDHDAAVDGQAGAAGQRGGRAAPCGQHDQIGLEGVPVVQSQPALGPVVGEPHGAGAGVHRGAEPLETALEDSPGRRPDLAAEQVFAALDHLGVEPADRQRAGHLESEEPPTDHDRPPRRSSSLDRVHQPLAVVEAAERVHLRVQGAVRPDQPADRRQRGDAAGGQDEPVVADARAVSQRHLTSVTVQLEHPGPETEVDAVAGVPLRRPQGQRRRSVGALEDGGEQDPVVRRVQLLAEHRDPRVPLGDELLHETRRSHAGSDDDDVIPGHRPTSSSGLPVE
jgi:hypothetical protein